MPQSNPSKAVRWVVAIQWCLAIFLIIAPFGFDHPSSWGLDFDDLIRLLGILAALSLVAMILAVMNKDWSALAACLIAPIVSLAGLVVRDSLT
jgi:hypothetical protein